MSTTLELLDVKVTIERHILRLELDRAQFGKVLEVGGLDNVLIETIVIDNPVTLK